MVSFQDIQAAYYMVAATGVLVAAGYYVMNLRITQRNQELSLKAQQQAAETRQAQLFMQVFSRYHETEFWKIYTQIMNREWKSYDDWFRDRVDPSISSMRLSVGTYFEGIGTLVERGLLPSDLVADILSGVVVMWWDKQGEFIKEFRAKSGYTSYGEKMEYLYDEMKRVRSAGFSPKYSGLVPSGSLGGVE